MDTTTKSDTVTITYNGDDKVIDYKPDEKVRAVLTARSPSSMSRPTPT